MSSCATSDFCSTDSYACSSAPTAGSRATGGTGGAAGLSGMGGTSAGTSTGGTGAAADGGQAGDSGSGGASPNGGRGGSSASGGGGGEGGGDAGTAGGGAECDSTLSPDQDHCVTDERFGVFVSPIGDDKQGDGSRGAPYATLGRALDVAATRHKRVYSCADGGHYTESVSIDAAAAGIEMFGGFSCDGWSYSTARQTRVTSPTPLALHIEGVDGVRIEGFRFEAADADAPGESSVGAFVSQSTGVVFRRTTITAGNGSDGANGVLEEFTYKDRSELDGNAASGVAGGARKICECELGLFASGGDGGVATPSGQAGSDGTPDLPGPGGEGGTPGMCTTGGAGHNGGNAPSPPAASGANTLGKLASSGWTPAAGANGVTGSPGQGGGGGASSATGGGGGGGCGSCGGAGGPGGQGGGASVALLVYESDVTVEDSKLVASGAGSGGNGAVGQAAQQEAGFGGMQAPGACQGGAGGLGADGAPGGGAAGGLSVGILWKGEAEPTQSDVIMITGEPGSKGVGGEPGVNDGIDGEAAEVLEAS